MTSKRSLPIRWRMPLLLLVLTAPLLAWLAVSVSHQAQREEASRAENLESVARAAAAELDAQVAEVSQTLALLGAVCGTDVDDAGRNHLLMQELAAQLPPQVADLNVWTAEGQNAGALDTRQRRPGTSVAYRRFFVSAVAEAGLAFETPVSAVRGSSPAVFARRIERDGRVVGVVSATVRLEPLQHALASQAGATGTSISVADARGAVLARSLGAEHGTVSEVELPVQAPGARSDPEAAVLRSTRTPWWVHATWTSAATPPVDWRIGAALLVLGLVTAGWFSGRAARSLRRFAQDIERFSRGEWTHRSDTAGPPEVRDLASALNRMAGKLAEREKLLELSEESLADLYQNAPFGYYSLDTRGCFVRVNDTALGWFGCTREELIGRMSITDFMRADGRAAFQANFPRLMRENRVDNVEFDLVGKAGQVRRVVVSATAVRDAEGAFCLTRTAMHDLTEVRAAAAVRQAEPVAA